MRRKTSLIVAATAALITGLALGSPVAAQAGRLLTGADLKDGTVTTVDVANGSLKKKDFAPGALPPAGADGAAGPQGEQGVPGPEGPAGPEGPSGVVTMTFESGPITRPATSWAFIAPTATVVVNDDQVVSVISSAAVGAGIGTNGARDLELDICYREVDGILERLGSSVTGLTAFANHEHLFTLTGVKENLASGSYDLGLCGISPDAADWSVMGGGQTTVQVLETD